MGINVNVSKPIDLNANELLGQFCGKQHISADNNEFWDSFLKFTIKTPSSSEEQLNLDSRLETFLEQFIQNNLTSGNFGSLITIFLQKAADVLSLNDTESHLHVYKPYNCVFVLRILIKYILEIGSEFLLLQHFEALPRVGENNGTSIACVSASGDVRKSSEDENHRWNEIRCFSRVDFQHHLRDTTKGIHVSSAPRMCECDHRAVLSVFVQPADD